ncbi:histidine phosphatase superfamily [Myxozyma melibiosi]|uniref:Histidine phosphatase superfamily n=1 Tax=Myxozyma melibiosi TaxID=54550 RepID=A0ABR1F023_9ASCO
MGPPVVYPDQIEAEYPSTLRLKQVQILFRHGERTPVHRSSQHWHKWNFPTFWPLCDSSRFSLISIVNPAATPQPVAAFPFEREIESLTEEARSGRGVAELFTNKGMAGVCLEGQLTDKGRLSGFRLGEQLRALYIDRLGLLPKTFTDQSEVYLRTTSIVRSRETLQQVFAGLYPFKVAAQPPKIHERFPFEEDLYPTTHLCPRLRELRTQFLDAAAGKWDPLLEGPAKKLDQILTGEGDQRGITVGRAKGKDSAWAIVDTYASALAHNIKTPAAFSDREAVNTLARASIDSEFVGYEQNGEMKRLGMGKFFYEVLKRMTVGDVVRGPNDAEIAKMLERESVMIRKVPKMALYAAHDSSVGAMLATMGVLERKWINFTTHIIFELFESKSEDGAKKGWLGGRTQAEQFVRVKYNGRPVALPACAGEGGHLEGEATMCTMGAFKEFVKSVTPGDYAGECGMNLGERVPGEQLAVLNE